MIQEAALLSLAVLLSIAAWQDVKTREIDVKLFIAMAPPAFVLLYLNWGDPLYLYSLTAGLATSLLLRILCAGYADSIAVVAISTAPPVSFIPTAFFTILAGSTALPVTMVWLYAKNRNKPCKMTTVEKLTQICVSREEFYSSVKYVHTTSRLCIPFRKNPGDLERYDPKQVKLDAEWVKTAYGTPYLTMLSIGFVIYIFLKL